MAASSKVVFKGQQCVWGTNEVNSPVSNGIVVSASVGNQANIEPVEDENGARIGMALYDEAYSGTVTVVCLANSKDPDIGALVKIDNFTCYVTGVRKEWQNKGKKQIVVSVEGGKYVK